MKLFLILMLMIPVVLHGQGKASGFFSLGAAEKWWVITHPFRAGRAFRAMQETRVRVDSLYTTGVFDRWIHGGRLDAYRHTYWMAITGSRVGVRAARRLGRAHERSNYRDYLKGKTEEGILADATATEMDLHNNEAGLLLGMAYRQERISDLHINITELMKSGQLRMLKMDEQGRLLDCQGRVCARYENTANQWKLPVCLIPTF